MHDGADDLTHSLVARVSQATGLRTAAASASQAAQTDLVEVRLLAIRPRPEPRVRERADLLSIDYLVAVRVADALAEHRAAADILFALSDDPEFEVVDQTAAAACTALGLPVAAGVVVRGTIARVRPTEKAPLVRFPLATRLGGLGTVEGQVQGPAQTPVAGALVNLIGLDRFVRTDADGRFRLTGPAEPHGALRVRVRARGVEAEAPVTPGEPAIVTLTMES
ncbi:carboxypeptidase-like regulatory domain-containing protein [Sphingomonas sp. DT-204]|uniref:carboxypeptidase-like regulatory domain-containing protein n=1 Tax=Sphingomonas sp. DT-204 TaxID=3396166 RepID=UPI003F1D3972